MKDVLNMLQTGGSLTYLVLALFALPVPIRGFFALTRSRSQSRKEFLELWKDGDKSDDFWLELMIRHGLGERFLRQLSDASCGYPLPQKSYPIWQVRGLGLPMMRQVQACIGGKDGERSGGGPLSNSTRVMWRTLCWA